MKSKSNIKAIPIIQSGMIENLNLILLNIGFSELNANWNWKRVYSPFSRIYYVKEGEARTIIDGKTYYLKPQHLYLIPPFTLHDDECESCFSLYYIHFYEEALNKESVFDKYTYPLEVEASFLTDSLIQQLLIINPNRHLGHFDPEFYDNPPTFSQYIANNNQLPLHSIVETQGILLQLMSRFFAISKSRLYNVDTRINRSLQYVHENIGNYISISSLASLACLSEDHFIRIFKEKMKYTPLQYINTKKLEKAQLLLLTTDLSIKDIAYNLSFENTSYFNRIFKRSIGKTPLEYRGEYHRR